MLGRGEGGGVRGEGGGVRGEGGSVRGGGGHEDQFQHATNFF